MNRLLKKVGELQSRVRGSQYLPARSLVRVGDPLIRETIELRGLFSSASS